MKVEQLTSYTTWLKKLKDLRAKARIIFNVDKLSMGKCGNVKTVGGGVFELKINEGKGYRVYFVQHGESVIILLCGGDKSSQSKDIEKAKLLAKGV
ncbi:MAG: type II toxin-antitoxin system RelE/ParE family toxin [Ghiorsea sp.]|nr:type II toxin-antitoxin system RelE/ParE family toxin [Ghiorsea sp.]